MQMPMPITKYFTSCPDPYAEFFKICTPVSRKVMHACQLYHEVTLVASYTFIVECTSTNMQSPCSRAAWQTGAT